MQLSYEVRTHGLPGSHRWYILVRPEERRIEYPQCPLLAEIEQPNIVPSYVSQEAAERAGEAFLELVAGCPPRRERNRNG